ncbi:DEAD-box ATP-dependent RNA helicase 32-like [Zingiber officinale]|uniref:DEAD-box ATP-dependent RNA helicase 32-like n=1 Tax=Zingiber officinale TaxID=94328 RepID=UPI001C4B5EAC|nr:DEAD-box ATP-dependent RNA helicase 32-like [Zingiber officinale]
MRRPNTKSHTFRKQRRFSEEQEMKLLDSWIEACQPDSGTNPLAATPPPPDAPAGRTKDGGFSPYAGVRFFRQLPISKKSKDGLAPKYVEMSEIQRATLPHSLCGRDILGAAKTGSGKTLAFIIPVIEKLYRARWVSEDGIGGIIISPTKELAGQLFDELKIVGKHHSLIIGLLIGGCKDVNAEKERVNNLNILICTPGRLLQHMLENPNFDCSQLQILVLDEADRILDAGFREELDAIISYLPRQRQTLLFSATQTKSVKDLARLSLKNPEYISVHDKSVTATPEQLTQFTVIVPLDQKLSMLWSFIKANLKSKILVFLTSCKQVKFVFEAFRKLRPGIPLKCLHGRMKQNARMLTYLQFCEETSVLFSTDVASRGLDFSAVDWVVQADCPEDIATYIHRVGRTARFKNTGKSLLFLMPSEMEMLTRLRAVEPKIPIKLRKAKEPVSISALLASLQVKYPSMQQLAQRALVTYLKSIYHKKDKEVFDVTNLPIEDFAASLGLSVTPKMRFLKRKLGVNLAPTEATHGEKGPHDAKSIVDNRKLQVNAWSDDVEDKVLIPKESSSFDMGSGKTELGTWVMNKKKLKINLHRPTGTRVKFDDDGNVMPPLAALADTQTVDSSVHLDAVKERYNKLREEMAMRDKEDKLLHYKRLREKRIKEKQKLKRLKEEEGTGDDQSGSDENEERIPKRNKIYFNDDVEDNVVDNETTAEKSACLNKDSATLAAQEALALQLLRSMHS